MDNIKPLPPVESTPLLLLRFRIQLSSPSSLSNSGDDSVLLEKLEQHLKQNGLVVLQKEESGGSTATNTKESEPTTVIWAITTTQENIEIEAEHFGCVKTTVAKKTYGGRSVMMEFTVENRDKFIRDDGYGDTKNVPEFNSGERIRLCYSIFETLPVLMKDRSEGDTPSRSPQDRSTPLSRYLDDRLLSLSSSKSSNSSNNTRFESSAKKTSVIGGQTLLVTALRDLGVLESVTPIHDSALRKNILIECWKPWTPVPVDEIATYYGEEVAFYYAWLQYFTDWLILPGFGGILVYAARIWRKDTVETDEWTPFFGVLMCLWAAAFMIGWDRHESRLAHKWGTYGLSPSVWAPNPQFHGVSRVSPVTGRTETYYDPNVRRLQYIASAIVTLTMLTFAFGVMIISLNVQGYVHPSHDPERWYYSEDTNGDEYGETGKRRHPFYIPFFASFAEPDHIFDVNSNVMSLIPGILHAITIQAMNAIYRSIAEALTEWENHTTHKDRHNSLILKRFAFEFFDCYVALFYLAFYERDMSKLCGELKMVFIIDSFRRLLLECLLPLATRRFNLSQERRRNASHKKHDNIGGISDGDDNNSGYPLLDESNRDTYELFDDYLEMVIEFGYITLFASAIPLGAFFSYLANQLELRTDCSKMAWVVARPRPFRTDTIGTWKVLMRAIVTMSALTNCLIFGLSSRQLMEFVPDLYYIDGYGKTRWTKTGGAYIMTCIFCIERALLFAHLLMRTVVPAVPEDVTEAQAHANFVKTEEAKLLRFEQRQAYLKQDTKNEGSEKN